MNQFLLLVHLEGSDQPLQIILPEKQAREIMRGYKDGTLPSVVGDVDVPGPWTVRTESIKALQLAKMQGGPQGQPQPWYKGLGSGFN